MNLERRIRQRVRDSKLAERWSDRADDDFLRRAGRSLDNKSFDKSVVARADRKPGGDVAD
jgi:hypothetical protein